MTPLASGRTADVFALDASRVLRRYRIDIDAVDEAAVMARVAARGFPVPRVYEARGRDLVLERLYGPTMREAVVAGGVGIAPAARMLAGLHARLHAIPARSDREPGGDPGDRLLHLDLHPENVLLTPRGPVVIDWCNAGDGPPDLDVALTALILAEVVGWAPPPLADVAARFLRAFVRESGWHPPRMLDRAVAYRRANPTLDGAEVARLADAAARVLAAAG